MSPSRTEQLSELVFGIIIFKIFWLGHLEYAIAIAQKIRKLPETNGASEGFSLLYELVWFSLVAQASKFAGLSDAMHSGMSVAKFIIARLN